MVSDILYKKKMGVPWISLIFSLNCILVSLPTCFFPQLYGVFGGEKPLYYPWQEVTHHLQHGTILGTIPLIAHLLCNLLVIMVLGVISERILGTKKFFVVSSSAFLMTQIVRMVLNIEGNGASGIAWVYGPIAFASIYYLYRKYKTKILKDPMFYLSSFILLAIWVFITIINIIINNSNLFHIISTITGIAYAYIWRGHIVGTINGIIEDKLYRSDKYDLWDKRIIYFNFLVHIFIITILVFVASGVLTNHISSSEVLLIYPQNGSVDVINRADNQIVIKFTKPMQKKVSHSSFSLYSQGDGDELSKEVFWEDDQTLCIKFNRNINAGEGVKIVLKGFYDKENKKSYDKITLEYGF